MLALCYVRTAMSEPVFITACTEERGAWEFDNEEKNSDLVTVKFTMWKLIGGKKFCLHLSWKIQIEIFILEWLLYGEAYSG